MCAYINYILVFSASFCIINIYSFVYSLATLTLDCFLNVAFHFFYFILINFSLILWIFTLVFFFFSETLIDKFFVVVVVEKSASFLNKWKLNGKTHWRNRIFSRNDVQKFKRLVKIFVIVWSFSTCESVIWVNREHESLSTFRIVITALASRERLNVASLMWASQGPSPPAREN